MNDILNMTTHLEIELSIESRTTAATDIKHPSYMRKCVITRRSLDDANEDSTQFYDKWTNAEIAMNKPPRLFGMTPTSKEKQTILST